MYLHICKSLTNSGQNTPVFSCIILIIWNIMHFLTKQIHSFNISFIDKYMYKWKADFDTASCTKEKGTFSSSYYSMWYHWTLNIAGVPSHKVKLALRDHFSNYQEKICPKAFKNETWPTLQLYSNGMPAQKQCMTFKS